MRENFVKLCLQYCNHKRLNSNKCMFKYFNYLKKFYPKLWLCMLLFTFKCKFILVKVLKNIGNLQTLFRIKLKKVTGKILSFDKALMKCIAVLDETKCVIKMNFWLACSILQWWLGVLYGSWTVQERACHTWHCTIHHFLPNFLLLFIFLLMS